MRSKDPTFIRQINLIPKGEHPRRNLYTKQKTEEIAAILKITDTAKIRKLRRKLVETALLVLKVRQVKGSTKFNKNFLKWLSSDLANHAIRLQEELENPARGGPIPVHAGLIFRNFEGFQNELSNFIKSVNFFIDQLKEEKTNNSRHITIYKEQIVGLLTGIYITELQRKPTRIVNNEIVYGEFADFIRAAGRPLLTLEIEEDDKAFKRHEKFNRQIQQVVGPTDPKDHEPFLRK